jgi:hypothetical protein
MSRTRIGAAVMGIALVIAAGVSRLEAAEIGPETDLCRALDALQPGEELLLSPGDYPAGCSVRRGGTPGAPVVIRSAEARPARLVSRGQSRNLLEIHTSDVTIRGLHFGANETDGVRIISGHRVIVEECEFSQIAGIAVVANHTSIRGLTVRRNVILDSGATAMYFGCHDGFNCTVGGLVIEGNLIRGVTAVGQQIGYGMQVKLNSSGIIRDNVVLDTKGPGIMVYGSRDLVATSVVERNFVRGSRTSSGIVLGGGPVLVRNNVSGWNSEAGIGLENYGGRGLLRGIVVIHNSVYANQGGGIMAPERGPIEAALVNNAVHARAGTPALPAARPGLRMAGNVDCSFALCFANPDALDFSPFTGSILLGRGLRADPMVPRDDFFGTRRGELPTIGAVDQPNGPIRLGLRPQATK